MLFSQNSIKKHVKDTAIYDSARHWKDHFDGLNTVIRSYYPDYQLDIDQDSEWFAKIIGGYQTWLMREYICERIAESYGKSNINEFFLLTLEDYLEKCSFFEKELVMNIPEYTSETASRLSSDASRVLLKMELAVAINRAKIYQRSDLEFFTHNIIEKIDSELHQ